MDCSLLRLLRPWDFPGKSTGVGCHFLLQGIFPTQELNPGLLHCRQTLYGLSYQGGSWLAALGSDQSRGGGSLGPTGYIHCRVSATSKTLSGSRASVTEEQLGSRGAFRLSGQGVRSYWCFFKGCLKWNFNLVSYFQPK